MTILEKPFFNQNKRNNNNNNLEAIFGVDDLRNGFGSISPLN